MADEQLPESAQAARSFATTFALLGEGDANSEASIRMHELAQALQDEALRRNTQVKGSLTIKLAVSIDPRGVVGITWDITKKDPPPQRVAAALWVDKHGHLVHTNPRQQQLFPREVRGERAEVRELEAPAPREPRAARTPKEV